MLTALGSAALRWSVSLLRESHLEGIVDLPAPESWSKNHIAEVVPVGALHQERTSVSLSRVKISLQHT